MVWTRPKNGRGKLPKEVMKWRPPGRRKRGRPKLTWAEGIGGLMGEKGLMEEDWNGGNIVQPDIYIYMTNCVSFGRNIEIGYEERGSKLLMLDIDS
jgi:hypothetical protein